MVGEGMKRAFRKNIFRTIKKSMGRYMAIFAIIALGVGFFAGLKVSKPAMMKTGQEYLKQQEFYDYRLISTWGFTDEEAAEIGELEGVQAAEGAVWEDFLAVNSEGSESCLKAMSITEQVNKLSLEAGRMPEKANECVLDAVYYPESMIGREIAVSSGNSKETIDAFAYDVYTVTGLVRTPLYLNKERGTTSIGNGKIESFMYLPLDGFSYEYLKEVYVITTVEGEVFSEQYEEEIEERTDSFTEGAEIVLKNRYQTEIAKAETELKDARAKLTDKVADAQQELLEAEQELTDARAELEDGEAKLQDAKAEFADAERVLEEKEQELTDGEAALEEGEAQYQQGLAQYQSGYAQYEGGLAELESNRSSYQQAKAGLEQIKAAYVQQLGTALETPEGAAMLEMLLSKDTNYQMLTASIASFEDAQAALTRTFVQLEDARQQLEESGRQLEQSRKELEEGKRQIAEARTELAEGKQELAENQKTIEDGWKEYEEGLAEYEDGKRELEKETKDAEAEIAEAEEELADVKEPELMVLDRSSNSGYAGYENDVSIVEGVARIFPIFFFLIAALVCSTTMTRMVDDERTQIGTLRALGYSEGAILGKYLIYSGSAAILGASVGYFFGTRLFPVTIWIAYGMLYGFAEIILVDNLWLFVLSLAVSLLCSAGTTYAACRLELSHAPAELIRPKAPAAGKRILLEKIPFLWKRLKFLHKVSARNVFRFKKRMIMMILGIAGCTALVVAGFGVKDSISDIVNTQYDKIFQYEISGVFGEQITEEMETKIEHQFETELENAVVLMETAVEAPFEFGSKNVTLLVSEGEKLNSVVDFHLGNEKTPLPGKGEILIDTRLAEVLKLSVGDEITLSSEDTLIGPLKVAGIFENYTFYYAYITSDTYEKYFSKSYEPKSVYLSLKEEADPYEVASSLSNMEDISYVSVVEDLRIRVGNMMESINFVVALIIGCAAALAFIVLFNLGNINISERVREIATLKVLGFYPRETGAYVFRENMILSLMGICAGIPLGILLHRFVMLQLKVDMVTFEIQIKAISYCYAFLAVLLFTVCVDLIMRRKINRIDMAESLKSIE